MNYKLKLIILSLIISFSAHSQSGLYIFDEINKEPIEGASVENKSAKKSYFSDINGFVKLSNQKVKLQISHVGFFKKNISFSGKVDTVFLKSSGELKEIVIMPDSLIKTILKRAFNSIEKNYPTEQFVLNGIFQEENKIVEDNSIKYFSESSIEVLHPSFLNENKKDVGQISVLKVHHIKEKNADKERLYYFSGPYQFIDMNPVLRKNDVINPKNFKKYDYSLSEILDKDNKQVYVINYINKDSTNKSGKIYINKADYAYTKIEIGNYKNIFATNLILIVKFNEYTNVFEFLKYGEKYYPSFFIQKFDYVLNSDPKSKITRSFVAFPIDSNKKVNTKNKDALLFTDVFKNEAKNLDSVFTDEYKILDEVIVKNKYDFESGSNAFEKHKTLKGYKTIEKQKELNFIEKLGRIRFEILKNYSANMGLNYLFLDNLSKPSLTNFGFIDKDFETKISTNHHKLSLNYIINFQINKHFSAFYDVTNVISKADFLKNRFIGTKYNIILNPSKKPIYIVPKFGIFIQESGLKIDTIKGSNPAFRQFQPIFSKRNNIQMNYTQFKFGIQTGLDISLKTWRANSLFLNFDYQIGVKQHEPKFRFTQASSIPYFPKKIISIEPNDASIKFTNLNESYIPNLKNNLMIGISLRRNF